MIKIYGTKICYHCIEAKEYFQAKKIPFEWIDVNEPENEKIFEEMTRKYNTCAVPQIQIGDMHIIGFNQDKIKQALDLEEK